jgi:Uncharacterized protein conserved in bacteria (DUF2147)
MKKLLAVAALLLASSAAQAQYTFEYGGKTIRVDPDRGTVQIPGVYDNTKKAKKSKGEEAPAAKSKQPETTTTTAAPPPAAPVEQQPAAAAAPPPPGPAPAAVAAPAAPPIQAPIPPPLGAAANQSTATAAASPSDNSTPPTPSAPPLQQTVAPPPPPAAAPAPAPTVAVAPPPAAPAAPPPAPRPVPAVASNSPIGVWLTEEKEGKVRIEQCGANLCGYSVDKKTNQNGEQVLINMKPGKDKWSGRILDPSTGSTYDSTIAMKGTETLRVQGCAFGGVFCGGQTWTRVN